MTDPEDRPVSICPLRVETEEEKQLFALGEKNYNAKKALAKINLRKQTPNDLESDLIHEMWLKQLEYHGESCCLGSLIVIYVPPILKPNNGSTIKTPISQPVNLITQFIWTLLKCTQLT